MHPEKFGLRLLAPALRLGMDYFLSHASDVTYPVESSVKSDSTPPKILVRTSLGQKAKGPNRYATQASLFMVRPA